MSKYPSIPEFTDLPSLMLSVRAVKDTVEQLAGQRQGDALGAPTMYVQATRPAVTRGVILKRGDFWIDTASDTLHYWSGSEWRRLAT